MNNSIEQITHKQLKPCMRDILIDVVKISVITYYGTDGIFNCYFNVVNGYPILYLEDIESKEFGVELTISLAAALGFDSIEEMMNSDKIQDGIIELKNGKFPIIKMR
jgi:hypothetical protein